MRYVAREPVGVVLHDRAVELPLPHRGQLGRPGADGRQRGGAEACGLDAARRRAVSGGIRPGEAAEGRVPASRAEPRAGGETSSPAGRSNMVCFTGSVAAGKAMEAGGGRHGSSTSASSSAARTRPTCGPTPTCRTPSRTWSTARSSTPGQSCCGIERIYVHKQVWDDFLDGFVDLTRQVRARHRRSRRRPRSGPMVQAGGGRRSCAKQIASAVRAGAKPHVDPKAFAMDKAGTPYMAPQVLTDVTTR